MGLLEITGLSHTYGDKRLYRNTNLSLYKDEHMGIVDSNGAGKSTLINPCAGEVIPNQGSVVWQPGMRLWHLDQYVAVERIRKYSRKYSVFLKQKQRFQEDYLRRYHAQQRELQRTEEFIRWNIAGVNTKNAQGKRKQLARLERIAPPEQSVLRPVFQFQASPGFT